MRTYWMFLLLAGVTSAGPLHDELKNINPRYSVVETLLVVGCYVNGLDKRGETPLHYACLRGADDVVALLLAQPGIEVDIRNTQKWTPLHKAAYKGSIDCMELLLQQQACLESKNNCNRTPLHIACYQNHLLAAIWLIDNRADINAKDHDGKTPLQVAYPDVRDRLEQHIKDRAETVGH